MTLVEFLHPLRAAKHRELVLAVMYFFKTYEDTPRMTVGEIRAALMQGRAPRAKVMNINDVLGRASPLVNAPGERRGRSLLFELTTTGEAHVRDQLGLTDADSEILHDAGGLRSLVEKVTDPLVRGYVEEAIACLEVGALRAAIVFVWTAGIRELHEQAWSKGFAVVNNALKKQDPRTRDLRKADDFAYVKDRTFLDAASDIGLVDKGQKDTLVDALNLRNRCGHPTNYRPGVEKARSFIEDVVGIVWT